MAGTATDSFSIFTPSLAFWAPRAASHFLMDQLRFYFSALTNNNDNNQKKKKRNRSIVECGTAISAKTNRIEYMGMLLKLTYIRQISHTHAYECIHTQFRTHTNLCDSDLRLCLCYLLYIIFASDSVDIFFLFRYSFHNDFFAMHIM